jgi:hydroxypyruvate isomerase
MSEKQHRRTAIKNMVAGSAALAAGSTLLSSVTSCASAAAAKKQTSKSEALKGNINHSVCYWTYNFISLDELCKHVKEIGFNAIDLVGPKDWATLKKYNIYSSMCYTGGTDSIVKGWNDPAMHAKLIKDFTDVIPQMVQAGYKDVITFSGNRNGMDDETGLKNCAAGLKQVVGAAEKAGITIQMELLNSKVDHKDYMCDHSKWGVELCKAVGSPNFKLLYDIYHMQIDEGDVIRTIRDNHEYFGHYHTGGVPGRHEIDQTQELYYPAIMQAIVDTGFKGYVAQEFIPAKQDKIASLRQAVQTCDV